VDESLSIIRIRLVTQKMLEYQQLETGFRLPKETAFWTPMKIAILPSCRD
jgi:hypothetical protein